MSEPKATALIAVKTSEPAEIANKSVTKAVRLLRELASRPKTGTTVSTLAKAVGISRPTAFRLLYSLERTGMVDRIDNNYILARKCPDSDGTPTPMPVWPPGLSHYCRSWPTSSTKR